MVHRKTTRSSIIMNDSTIFGFLSGKGGVGKSFIASNLATEITKKGYKVAVIDCDLGFSNISTFLNRKVNFTVIDWINQRASLNDIIDITPQCSLITVSNNFDHNGVNSETLLNALDQLLNHLKLNYDFILIDSPAGTPPIAFWILDVSNFSNLVLIDEPTSISDVYRLCKYVYNVKSDYRFNAIINQTKNETDGLNTYDKFRKLVENFLKKEILYLGQVYQKEIIADYLKINQCLQIIEDDKEIKNQFHILSKNIIELTQNSITNVIG